MLINNDLFKEEEKNILCMENEYTNNRVRKLEQQMFLLLPPPPPPPPPFKNEVEGEAQKIVDLKPPLSDIVI